MPTINGNVCVANGKPVDKVFSNGRQVYGRNLLTGTSSDLKTKQLTNSWNVDAQATNGYYKIKVVKGQTYTYRAWLDNTNGPSQAFVNTRFMAIVTHEESTLGLGSHIGKGETGYSTVVITPTKDGVLHLIPFAYGVQETALVSWKEEKLEKGNVATPYSPAPEDIM